MLRMLGANNVGLFSEFARLWLGEAVARGVAWRVRFP